ncbi:conserved protein of unknown function [Rhodovastum atsumiense]|uniref:Uncharacterized protein n=1 Tax=Rhodovastum atsumiense TaxID=504468 RepID=A0A5M6J275_9PROT|nr:hypothetical protein [Rhodovastum atsumiense]KAA5614700.1 hypothetical protein F1189_00805 [Rhodovastum atsumiense]CAH2599766.1 conserved protein of unknown function [Rhodovastum atsumiense]
MTGARDADIGRALSSIDAPAMPYRSFAHNRVRLEPQAVPADPDPSLRFPLLREALPEFRLTTPLPQGEADVVAAAPAPAASVSAPATQGTASPPAVAAPPPAASPVPTPSPPPSPATGPAAATGTLTPLDHVFRVLRGQAAPATAEAGLHDLFRRL